MKKKVLLVGNCYTTIAGFRAELISELVRREYDVYISFPNHSHGEKETGEEFAREYACKFIELGLDRRSKKISKEIRTVFQLKHILHIIKPDFVLTFTIKPNLYMGYLCKGKISFIPTITGLGSGINDSFLGHLLLTVYIHILNYSKIVFFQNSNDYELLHSKGYRGTNAFFVPGSGVNLERFSLMQYPGGESVRFLYIARVMQEKGINEFLAAARIFADRADVIFEICGDCEETYEKVLKEMSDNKEIIYHGRVSDVRPYIAKSSCVVLPTFYNEGISNCLLEAAACGRPVITTDHSGCREVVENGVTGFLIKVKDQNDLVNKIYEFLNLPIEDRKKMGEAARKKVENEFDRKRVVDDYLIFLEKSVIAQ